MRVVKQRATCPWCRAVFMRQLRACPMDGTPLTPLPEDPLVGSTLGDRYWVASVLGDGAMARTYRVTDTRTDEMLAAKVLYGDYATVDRHRARFAQAARISTGLGHPNVVAAIDADVDGPGLPYMITELVEGPLLSEIIADEAPLSAARALELLRQITAGLEHVHERGVVHRRLSPASVVVTPSRDVEVARIFDFGIAVRPTDSAQRLTRGNKVVGTPAYMSPEQAEGGDSGPSSDLYNLGLVLYEMLVGRHPFSGAPVMVAALHGTQVPPIVLRRPDDRVGPAMADVTYTLLQADPSRRFASATDLLQRLDVI